jgi:hypothetical protein
MMWQTDSVLFIAVTAHGILFLRQQLEANSLSRSIQAHTYRDMQYIAAHNPPKGARTFRRRFQTSGYHIPAPHCPGVNELIDLPKKTPSSDVCDREKEAFLEAELLGEWHTRLTAASLQPHLITRRRDLFPLPNTMV